MRHDHGKGGKGNLSTLSSGYKQLVQKNSYRKKGDKMKKPKYIIEIEMLPKNCLAFKEGSVATCSFNKTFGSGSSSSSPIKNKSKDKIIDSFRNFIRRCKEYDGILERDIRPNEYPSRKNMTVSISSKYKDITEQDIWDELDKINNGSFQLKLG